MALTAADWARRKGLGEEAVNHARTYALEAERRMGELLSRAAESGQRASRGERKSNIEGHDISTLSDLGISLDQSSRAQFLAEIPRKIFEAILERDTTIAEVKRQIRKEELAGKAQALPRGKYRVIYADPPWSYGNSGPGIDQYGPAERQYPAMSLADLCVLEVKSLAADDAVFFLWVTSSGMVTRCPRVLDS